LLHYGAEDPLSHAANWNKPLAESDLDAYAAAIDRWTDFDETNAISQISFGAIVLRGADGSRGVIRADPLLAGHGSASAQIERVFAAYDDLTSSGDSVLDRRLRLVDGHRFDQSLVCSGGEWQLQSASLALVEGIGFDATRSSY
jgi:hypothetical protein